MNNKWINTFLMAAAIVVGGAMPSQAAFLGCPADATCNGNTYAWSILNTGGNAYTVTVTIGTAGFLPAGPTQIGLQAVEIKDFTSASHNEIGFRAYVNNVLQASPTFTPGGGLNASGCGNGNAGDSFCEETAATSPLTFVRGNTLKFEFDITTAGTVSTNFVHIKNLFVGRASNTAEWDKIGDLLSQNVSSSGGVPVNETGVPEPATYALMGSALLGVALLRRKQ